MPLVKVHHSVNDSALYRFNMQVLHCIAQFYGKHKSIPEDIGKDIDATIKGFKTKWRARLKTIPAERLDDCVIGYAEEMNEIFYDFEYMLKEPVCQ